MVGKQVLYYQHGRSPIRLHVVKDHGDGTFDLSLEAKGQPKITGIKISEAPADGAAVPLDAAPKPKAPKGAKGAKAAKADSQPEEQSEPAETDSADEESEADPAAQAGDPQPPPDE